MFGYLRVMIYMFKVFFTAFEHFCWSFCCIHHQL